MPHNREITVTVTVVPSLEDHAGQICVLLRDGRLFGPFATRRDALYWCHALDFEGFSTYDLLGPGWSPE